MFGCTVKLGSFSISKMCKRTKEKSLGNTRKFSGSVTCH